MSECQSEENKAPGMGAQLSAFVTIKDTELVALHQQLAAARAEVAELLPRLDADDMTITNLSRQLAAAEAREKAMRATMVRIIELRIADVGLCDSCPPNDRCSQCEARNALANAGGEEEVPS